MSDYYQKKVRANRLIDEMLSKGEPVENIYFKVDTIFGFTEKFVDKRIKRIKDKID